MKVTMAGHRRTKHKVYHAVRASFLVFCFGVAFVLYGRHSTTDDVASFVGGKRHLLQYDDEEISDSSNISDTNSAGNKR